MWFLLKKKRYNFHIKILKMAAFRFPQLRCQNAGLHKYSSFHTLTCWYQAVLHCDVHSQCVYAEKFRLSTCCVLNRTGIGFQSIWDVTIHARRPASSNQIFMDTETILNDNSSCAIWADFYQLCCQLVSKVNIENKGLQLIFSTHSVHFPTIKFPVGPSVLQPTFSQKCLKHMHHSPVKLKTFNCWNKKKNAVLTRGRL